MPGASRARREPRRYETPDVADVFTNGLATQRHVWTRERGWLVVRGQVLYVEDDDCIRYLYADALRSAGLIVQEERFAADAFDVLTSSRPDLILLDLGMPAGLMSGIEMLVRLRAVPQWTRIPVVVLSALGDLVNPDVMARLNVSNVLSKTSMHGDDLVRLIGDILQRQGGKSETSSLS
jgi:CheY-like chemotaxis protein